MSDTPTFKNAIWILGDQHPAHALSCNGDPNLNTPHLDRLAAEGQNYERAVAGFPLCCPFRGSMLTGLYPHECVPGHEYQMPHDPYLAPAKWMARHIPGQVQLRPNVPPIARVEALARRELAGAYAMIENLDWNVGRVRETLFQEGLDLDTHLVFFSDHGDMHGAHGQFRKTSPWEESIRVPFIVSGLQPRYGGRSGRLPFLVNHVDIAPTTFALCGIDPPDWMRGHDYSGQRLPGRPQRDAPDSAFLQCVIPTGHGDSVDRPWRGVVTLDGWKYVALVGQPWLMFHLNEDPYELANLAHNTRYRVERKRLHDRLAQWIDDTGDVFDLPEL